MRRDGTPIDNGELDGIACQTMNSTKCLVFHRILPFALFMAFIGLEEGLRFASTRGIMSFPAQGFLYLYPIKVITVGAVLVLFRSRYTELDTASLAKLQHTAVSVLTGLLVFILWINMDWQFATFGNAKGFDPTLESENFTQIMLIFTRLAGAAIVVPFMEELFWRSFLIRYIVDPEFAKVPLGLFIWTSFLVTALLFGLEHNLVLAGIMAGIAYNLLLYHTKSLSQCILAHAVTNLALGIYVLNTGKWWFW